MCEGMRRETARVKLQLEREIKLRAQQRHIMRATLTEQEETHQNKCESEFFLNLLGSKSLSFATL